MYEKLKNLDQKNVNKLEQLLFSKDEDKRNSVSWLQRSMW